MQHLPARVDDDEAYGDAAVLRVDARHDEDGAELARQIEQLRLARAGEVARGAVADVEREAEVLRGFGELLVDRARRRAEIAVALGRLVQRAGRADERRPEDRLLRRRGGARRRRRAEEPRVRERRRR